MCPVVVSSAAVTGHILTSRAQERHLRVEGAVTTISWIPSEAVTGPLNKPIFDSGVTHYDAPPPDFIGDLPPLGSWMAEDRFRFANRLSAAVDFADDGTVRTAELGERAVLEGGTRTASLRAVTAGRVAIAKADDIDTAALAELSEGHHREDA